MNLDRTLVRRLLATGSAGLLPAALAAPLAGPAAQAVDPFPTVIALPNGFLPEGITIGKGHQAFFGSRADGRIWGIDLRSGEGYPVSAPGVPSPGTPSVGLKIDRMGRLFVAGGTAGDGRVVDVETGQVLASYQFTTEPSFVNDVVLAYGAAWFTDSQQAQLYKVPFGPGGALPEASAFEKLPLSGDWSQLPGFNANGITTTPDHQALLVVNTTTERLYRVDPSSGAAKAVNLGGAAMTAGDGLLRVRGRILLVVQNVLNQISVVRLSQDGLSGEVIGTITKQDAPNFDVPTTVAKFGSRLYLPNARFTTPPEPTTPYSVTKVSMHLLGED